MYQIGVRGGQSPVFPKTSKLNVDQLPRLLVKDVTCHYVWPQCPRKPPTTSQRAQCTSLASPACHKAQVGEKTESPILKKKKKVFLCERKQIISGQKSHPTYFLEFDMKVNSFVDIIYIDLQQTFVSPMITVKY